MAGTGAGHDGSVCLSAKFHSRRVGRRTAGAELASPSTSARLTVARLLRYGLRTMHAYRPAPTYFESYGFIVGPEGLRAR
jgi:hypothetical protein